MEPNKKLRTLLIVSSILFTTAASAVARGNRSSVVVA